MTEQTAPQTPAAEVTLIDVLDPHLGLSIYPTDPTDPMPTPDAAVRMLAHVGHGEDIETSVLVDVDLRALLAAVLPPEVLTYLRDLLAVDGGDGDVDPDVYLAAHALLA